jgi:hypothetical protein
MEINTPHFNAIAGQFLTEASMYGKKKAVKKHMKPMKAVKKKVKSKSK